MDEQISACLLPTQYLIYYPGAGEGRDLETDADAIINELCQDLNATLLAAGSRSHYY
jgi:hypothetical protein